MLRFDQLKKIHLLKAFEEEVYLVKLYSRKIRAAAEEQRPKSKTGC
jgi:transposase